MRAPHSGPRIRRAAIKRSPRASPASSGLVTPEQARAIGFSGREVLIEAGAGTGKTRGDGRALLPAALRGGGLPTAILAFTFTDKAAAELRQRILVELAARAEGGSPGGQSPAEIATAWVTTIDGFWQPLCWQTIRSQPGWIRLPSPRCAESERAGERSLRTGLDGFLAVGDEISGGHGGGL